jgi:hypothetical protein
MAGSSFFAPLFVSHKISCFHLTTTELYRGWAHIFLQIESCIVLVIRLFLLVLLLFPYVIIIIFASINLPCLGCSDMLGSHATTIFRFPPKIFVSLVGSRKRRMDSWVRHLKYMLFCAFCTNFVIVCVCKLFVVSKFIYYYFVLWLFIVI